MEGKRFMRVVTRAYRDAQTKPHLRHELREGTLKANITDESDIEEAVEAYRELLYDSLEEWREQEDEDE